MSELHQLSVCALRLRGSSNCFLHFESRPVFPLLGLPDVLIAQTLSHLDAHDLVSASLLCKSCSAFMGSAASLRAERLGFPLPEPSRSESALRGLHFVQQLAAMRPCTIAAGSAHSLCTAQDGARPSCD